MLFAFMIHIFQSIPTILADIQLQFAANFELLLLLVMSDAAFDEALSNAAEYMNEEQPQLVLLFAWNYYGKLSAKRAKIVDMSRTGFVMSFSYSSDRLTGSADDETAPYHFPTPIESPNCISKVLGDLFNQYSKVCYPDAGLALIMIALWVILLIAVANDVDVFRYPSIAVFRDAIIQAVSPQIATYALIFLIVAHTFEGVYVSYLCQDKVGITKNAVITWIMMTLVMGYPTTSKAIYLAKIADDAKKKKKKRG